MASSGPDAAAPGPVLLAYDGSELAQLAIEQAARELAPGRNALVLCVWQPTDVGFVPVGKQHFNAQDATEVEDAAEGTAAHGAALAEKAGHKISVLVPQRGEKRDLVDHVLGNAREAHGRKLAATPPMAFA